MTIELLVSGMNCQHCVGAVTAALESVAREGSVSVDLDSGLARIESDIPADVLIRAVVAAGYDAKPAASG